MPIPLVLTSDPLQIVPMKVHCPHDKMVPIGELIPNPKNPNVHSDDQIERLAKILEYQGWRYPIKVCKQSGFITSGHGRLLAATKLGLKKVPVSFQDYESEEQMYADLVSDNAIASWAELKLADINIEIPNLGPDFDIDLLGIKNFKIDVAENVSDSDPDDLPEIAETRAKPGDVWLLGQHRLMCGDATRIDQVEALMAGERAHMVFTDPPYNTGMSPTNARIKGGGKRGEISSKQFFHDSFTDEEWLALLQGMTASMWAATRDTAALYICLDWRRSHELVPHLKALFQFTNLIVWDKKSHGMGPDYKYTHEFIHVCKKGKPAMDTHQGEDAEFQDVWRITRKVGARDDEHATKKPVEIVERAIRHASQRGESVLDLFGGSGTTLLASERLGRKCFMMELEPKYVDVTLSRWERFTGKTAVLQQ